MQAVKGLGFFPGLGLEIERPDRDIPSVPEVVVFAEILVISVS